MAQRKTRAQKIRSEARLEKTREDSLAIALETLREKGIGGLVSHETTQTEVPATLPDFDLGGPPDVFVLDDDDDDDEAFLGASRSRRTVVSNTIRTTRRRP